MPAVLNVSLSGPNWTNLIRRSNTIAGRSFGIQFGSDWMLTRTPNSIRQVWAVWCVNGEVNLYKMRSFSATADNFLAKVIIQRAGGCYISDWKQSFQKAQRELTLRVLAAPCFQNDKYLFDLPICRNQCEQTATEKCRCTCSHAQFGCECGGLLKCHLFKTLCKHSKQLFSSFLVHLSEAENVNLKKRCIKAWWKTNKWYVVGPAVT